MGETHPFADLVRKHRRRLGLSQEDLAHRSGMSVRGIRKIETSRTATPRPATVRMLAEALALTGADHDRFLRTAAAPAVPGADTGLVGRDSELTALLATADSAATGRFRLMWLAGEPGAGKSALAGALATTLSARGWRTAVGRCPEVDGAPSAWAWAGIARALLTGPAPDRLRPLLDGEPVAVFPVAQAMVELLRAADDPLLLVLDDVHQAGDETLQILRYAAAELAEHPLLVVATLRPDEAGPALAATRSALAGPAAGRLDLGGLDEAGVARMLWLRLGTPVAPGAVRLITARTAGNPLFVGETAQLIADRGLDMATELVPEGVGDVLRSRLAVLSPETRSALRTAAVFGVEVAVEAVLLVEPERRDATLDGLDAAVRAGFLTEPAPGVVRFSHVLVRDTVYQDLPQLRRVALHGEVLRALTTIRPGDQLTLAHHALAAAGPANARAAAERGATAGRTALARNAYPDAVTLLTASLSVLDRWPGGPDLGLRLELLCALVSAQAHAGDVVAARRARAEAIAVARRLGDPAGLARAYGSYDAPAFWASRGFQEPDYELIAGMESTLARPGLPDAVRCALLSGLALETDAHDPARTDQAGLEALEIATRLDNPVLICRALNARYRFVATLGPDRWCELDEIGKRQLDLAAAHGLAAYQAQAHHILSIARLARNDLDAAQRHLDRAVEYATSGQLGLALAIIAMFGGLRELVAGRFAAAEAAYEPVIAQLRHLGSPNADEIELLTRFCLEHARPGPARRQRMAALVPLARPVHERYGDAVAEPYVRMLLAAGRTREARAVWRPDVPIAADHYWFRWTALRAENAVRLADRATAAVCYDQLLPWHGHLPGLLHAHVTLGPVDHTLGDLAVALDRPDAAARHYADAATLADRLGSPHWAAAARAALRGDAVLD